MVERVLITGTTSGLGRALLDLYVSRGVSVISVNRRRVFELEDLYPQVHFAVVDIRNAEQVRCLVFDLAESGFPDVFLLNAGINRIDNDESFELERFSEVLDTNLYGVLNFVEPIVRMRVKGLTRHVIAVSSMARYVGNPYGLGYSTSKQAISNCFDAWSKMYDGTDLIFQQIMLGPVHTNIFTMAELLPRWMGRVKQGLSVTPEQAAEAIFEFATSKKKQLFYPVHAIPLYLTMALARSLVPGLFDGRQTLGGDTR